MAGKWIEGFESHRNTQQLARKYASVSGSINVAAGRVAGSSVQPNSLTLVTPSFGLSNTLTIGFGAFVVGNNGNLGNFNNGIYLEKGAAEQIHLEFQTNATGWKVKVVRGTGGSAVTLGETGFDQPFSAWVYVEFQVTIATGTGGSYELRVNGVTELTGTGVNTANAGSAGADVFGLRYAVNLTNVLRLDDMYVVDDSDTINNGFLGPSVVESIEVTSNGAENDWVNDASGVSDSNNFQQVDDPPTGGTDESGVGGTISSGTVGDRDIYVCSDLQNVTGNIHFVQTGIQAALDSAGSRTAKHSYRSPSAADGDGDTFTVDNTTYDEFTNIYDRNPATGASWDVADVDDGQFGIEVVS